VRDNEPQGNELLIYAGVGLYTLALVLQLFSFWANAYIWGWMSLKYFALLGLGLLPIVLFEGRSAVAKVLGIFYAVLALTGGLTYGEGSIEGHVNAKRHALETRIARAQRDWEAKNTSEWRNFKYYDELYASFFNQSAAARENMDAKEWEKKDKDLKQRRDDAEKAYQKERKSAQSFDAATDLADLQHSLTFDYPETKLAERAEALRWAKALDFFILLGAALFVAGSLVPGEPIVPPYSPPAPPAKQP
jgi:hypothetical protein